MVQSRELERWEQGVCEACGEVVVMRRLLFVRAREGVEITTELRLRCGCGEVPAPDPLAADDETV